MLRFLPIASKALLSNLIDRNNKKLFLEIYKANLEGLFLILSTKNKRQEIRASTVLGLLPHNQMTYQFFVVMFRQSLI